MVFNKYVCNYNTKLMYKQVLIQKNIRNLLRVFLVIITIKNQGQNRKILKQNSKFTENLVKMPDLYLCNRFVYMLSKI